VVDAPLTGTRSFADGRGSAPDEIDRHATSSAEARCVETKNANDCRTQAARQRGEANKELLPNVEARLQESARRWDSLADAYELIPGGASAALKRKSSYVQTKVRPLDERLLISTAAAPVGSAAPAGPRGAGPLTEMEQAILDLLVLNKGRIVSKASIMMHLYGEVAAVGPKIIDVAICRLRRKLAGVALGGRSIVTVRSRGYTFRDPHGFGRINLRSGA